MIITESNPTSLTEQSPLKGAVANASTSAGGIPAAPPPPYSASSTAIPSYQAIHTSEIQVHAQPPRPRTSTVERFIKAFAIAFLIIFLWGAFVDSWDMVRKYPKHRRTSVDYRNIFGVDHYVRRWWYDAVYQEYHSTPMDKIVTPGRVLPIGYPPTTNKVSTTISASVG